MTGINRLNEHPIPDLCIEQWWTLQPGWVCVACPLCKRSQGAYTFVNLVWFISFLLIVITAAVYWATITRKQQNTSETKRNAELDTLTRISAFVFIFRAKRWAIYHSADMPPQDVCSLSVASLATRELWMWSRSQTNQCFLQFICNFFLQFSFFIIKCFTRVNKLQNTYNVLSVFFFINIV